MKNEIKIYLAAPRGFCAGVDRAIEIVKKTLDKYGSPVYVRHEIVHNKNVVESLKKLGVLNISIDLTLPTFIETICSDLKLSREETTVIRDLLDKKDLASLRKLQFIKETSAFELVLNSIGPVNIALNILPS